MGSRARQRIPATRRFVQLYTAVLYNAHIRGFVEGDIYTGKTKAVCVPGLNCYSCPGAIGACPLGSLQNAVSASANRPAFYVVGLLLLFGLTLGRVVCGWLCPFGLIQELLYKIPGKKVKKGRWSRRLSWLKYGVLVVFALAIPAYFALRHVPLPGFCKYICPAGTLEGAVALVLHPANGDLRGLLGSLFLLKLSVMILVLSACAVIHRAFCRFLCPLGAIYSLFARLALLGVRVDPARCSDCGACVRVCPMDIRTVGDRECVHCGKCISVCGQKAISFRAGKLVLMGPELPERRLQK